MLDSDKYTCTSNIVKLFKHLDKLSNIQKGIISPVMVHVIPTHRCQLDCVHCCFKNREDKNADMSYLTFIEAIKQFHKLGVKALEFTGGGEPTLWPYLNSAVSECYKKNIKVGLITNGLALDRLKYPEMYDWIRISLNTLDYKDYIVLRDIPDLTKVTFCYIWNDNSPEKFSKVIDFANFHKIICRVAPDCIQSLDRIQIEIDHIKRQISKYKKNEYVFLSDFNINLYRKNNDCRIHMIKPCLYLDGWVYACPSAELAVENDKQIQYKTRICKYTEITDFYTNNKALKSFSFDCSYCKYVQQQEILEALLTETECNDFC